MSSAKVAAILSRPQDICLLDQRLKYREISVAILSDVI